MEWILKDWRGLIPGPWSYLDDRYAQSDVALYDLINDPGELQNLAHQEHPDYDPTE
jgi:hypothetical protein